MIERPVYGELIVTARTDEKRQAGDDDRERGGNGTKTRLATENGTNHVDVLSSPYIDEVSELSIKGRSQLQ